MAENGYDEGGEEGLRQCRQVLVPGGPAGVEPELQTLPDLILLNYPVGSFIRTKARDSAIKVAITNSNSAKESQTALS